MRSAISFQQTSSTFKSFLQFICIITSYSSLQMENGFGLVVKGFEKTLRSSAFEKEDSISPLNFPTITYGTLINL